jgi:transaldolase
MKIKLFGDGADKGTILELYKNPLIKGFTTNPTLMRKAGIRDYESFAKDILAAVPDRPFSLEVFDDNFDEMERQARKIASWGENVYVKIPIMNTKEIESYPLIRTLSQDGIKVNVTAMMTLHQVEKACCALAGGAPAYISIFAGRIADTGRDPVPEMRFAVQYLAAYPNVELIWASPRELLNIFQADDIGCHIITATNDILKKLSLVGKNLYDYSLDTVKMFYRDAQESGYKL